MASDSESSELVASSRIRMRGVGEDGAGDRQDAAAGRLKA